MLSPGGTPDLLLRRRRRHSRRLLVLLLPLLLIIIISSGRSCLPILHQGIYIRIQRVPMEIVETARGTIAFPQPYFGGLGDVTDTIWHCFGMELVMDSGSET